MTDTSRLTYAERAGMCLRAKLAQGKKAAAASGRRGFREHFAEQIGVDIRTLSRYCKSIHDIDTIAYIASELGVKVEEMLSYDGEHLPFFV